MYKELLADHKIGTCGYQLNANGEVIRQEEIPKEQDNDCGQKEKDPIKSENDYSLRMGRERSASKSEREVMKIKMVEKGVLQSQQIKENPLTQNMVIGKRGRPPGSKINGSKRRKSDSHENQIDYNTQRKV